MDIDPNHRKVKIEELKFEFLKTFTLWIVEQLKASINFFFYGVI